MSTALDPFQSATFPGTITSSGESVLVVDDDDTFRALVASRLEQRGAYVDQVASVREAIEALEREHVDLVVCDYTMPEANGTSLLAYVTHRGYPVRFVLTSASLPPEAAAAAHAHGARSIEKWDLLDLL